MCDWTNEKKLLFLYRMLKIHVTHGRTVDKIQTISFTELKGELEEIPNIWKNTSEHLPDDIIGPQKTSKYKKLETEKGQTIGYYILLTGYARSHFPVFEGYHRIVVGLDEDDIQMCLKQYNLNFVIYVLSPGI